MVQPFFTCQGTKTIIILLKNLPQGVKGSQNCKVGGRKWRWRGGGGGGGGWDGGWDVEERHCSLRGIDFGGFPGS